MNSALGNMVTEEEMIDWQVSLSKALLPTLEVRAIMLGHTVWPGSPIGDAGAGSESLAGGSTTQQRNKCYLVVMGQGGCVCTQQKASAARPILNWGGDLPIQSSRKSSDIPENKHTPPDALHHQFKNIVFTVWGSLRARKTGGHTFQGIFYLLLFSLILPCKFGSVPFGSVMDCYKGFKLLAWI